MMEFTPIHTILIVSGACCSPNLIRKDQQLEKALGEATRGLDISFDTRKVSLTHALHSSEGLTQKQRKQIIALFQAYNIRFTPALFVDDALKFAGDIPTAEKIKEMLKQIG